MDVLQLKKHSGTVNCTIDLASSKSESNRALIINALSGDLSNLSRLANARDTQTMQLLLSKMDSETWDVLDAGTTMRFLTAFAAAKGLNKLMTGTQRMQERPIGILVDALRELGASVSYTNNDGYPPHQIEGFTYAGTNKLTIRGDVSSQYISALLMIAPYLPKGLELNLTGKIGSKPYILMTLNLMRHFGVESTWEGNSISIAPQEYTGNDYTIEADWSGASYWYSIAALAEEANIQLNGLRKDSLQGDSVLVELMDQLGVATTFNETGVLLTKKGHVDSLTWDFTHCPDIAQTISVICAVKGIDIRMEGLESLRIKETDRIDAIANELKKFDVTVSIEGDEVIEIKNAKFNAQKTTIATYHDHRMAMAYAPLALLTELDIDDPLVVNKSYPDFWADLDSAGFTF
ncbi:MAG: 3-phosphoshikimate 1-carboxyvinyltransferase [Cyclobacteriaceae bacterium]